MKVTWSRFRVHKTVPLTISRGTVADNENLWVRLSAEGVEGWGEAAPVGFSNPPQEPDLLEQELQRAAPVLEALSPTEGQVFDEALDALALASSARAALDIARYDWLGKVLGWPLWKLWGLDRERIAPSTVTIGIMSPQEARRRVRQWQKDAAPRAWKVKLGSPEGLEADKAMVQAVQEVVPAEHWLMADANGGWSLEDARRMLDWLAARGVRYVEQPLAVGKESELPLLFRDAPLPIFADESCMGAKDIMALADRVHGINLKLLKAGGLTEARKMIDVAKICGLQVMFGCFAETLITNSAAAHLSPLADFLDLDSSLNLRDDPFVGALWQGGCLIPNDLPGLGVRRRDVP